jgi:hypothetical protein
MIFLRVKQTCPLDKSRGILKSLQAAVMSAEQDELHGGL